MDNLITDFDLSIDVINRLGREKRDIQRQDMIICFAHAHYADFETVEEYRKYRVDMARMRLESHIFNNRQSYLRLPWYKKIYKNIKKFIDSMRDYVIVGT